MDCGCSVNPFRAGGCAVHVLEELGASPAFPAVNKALYSHVQTEDPLRRGLWTWERELILIDGCSRFPPAVQTEISRPGLPPCMDLFQPCRSAAGFLDVSFAVFLLSGWESRPNPIPGYPSLGKKKIKIKVKQTPCFEVSLQAQFP